MQRKLISRGGDMLLEPEDFEPDFKKISCLTTVIILLVVNFICWAAVYWIISLIFAG